MNKVTFAYHAKALIPKGAITGAKWGFILFIVYIAVITITLFINTLFVSDASVVFGWLLFTFTIFALGVLPLTIAGFVGGGIIGLVLSMFNKAVSSFTACLVGLAIGVTLVLSANYLYWLISAPNYPGAQVSFLEFLFLIKADSFFTLINDNWYLIPSLIAVLISPYLGWRINTFKTIESLW
jgi:hypothetical protein